MNIEELVEAARTRAFDASLVAGIEEPERSRGMTFQELLEAASMVARFAKEDNATRQQSLARARLMLGPDASEEEVDEVARKNHAGGLVGWALAYRPEECSQAPVEGEGLELLRDPSRGAIVAFAHTITSSIGFYALPRAIGRLIFVPNERTPAQAPSIRMRQFWCEEFGLRYVMGDETCMQVMRTLLERDELCSLAIDQPGKTEATFFGRRVLTQAGAAVLAQRTGRPVVVGATWNDDEAYGVRLSAPLHAKDFASPTNLHQEMLTTAERLIGDVSRFDGDLELAEAPGPVAA